MWEVRKLERSDMWDVINKQLVVAWPARDWVDEGTAQTMCDVFNARDYPEEFMTGVSNDGTT
jgi:hypothetical protein